MRYFITVKQCTTNAKSFLSKICLLKHKEHFFECLSEKLQHFNKNKKETPVKQTTHKNYDNIKRDK